MQYKIEKTTWARHSSLHFLQQSATQNTLIKWKSDLWTYTTRHVGMSAGPEK